MKTIVLNLALFFGLILLSINSFGQTNYTLNGNLGVGESPTHKLSVAGDSKMTGELTVTEKTKLENDVDIEGDLKLTNLNTTGDGYQRLLIVDGDGNLKKMTDDDFVNLIDQIYSKECGPGMTSWNPTWKNDINKIYVDDCPSAELMVGIGLSNPTARFEVSGQESGYQFKINGLTSQKAFAITNNGEDKFTVSGTGLTGIGVNFNSDVQLLVEQSTTTSVGLCLNSLSNSNDTYGVKILSNNPNVKVFAINDAVSGGMDAFRIMGDGYMYATGINVLLKEEFPDYVFEKDYELMPLNELKTFIETNKRLPNMPSAEKVSQNGLDLGESDRLLTEKVEELTLYILMLNDKIETLIKENEELNTNIEK